MKCAVFAVLFGSAESQCCYQGCNNDNTGCNQPGDFCDNQNECESNCGGTWCGGPTPTPTPTPPTPSPTPAPSDAYCPTVADLTVHYGDQVTLTDGGWSVHGNGGGATRASFNLLGGYVEFDIDVSNVELAVNANLYAISPDIGPDGFQSGEYCDGAENDVPYCMELDFVESNGNCGAAATIHTVPGPGNDGCTAWGCRTHWMYNGGTRYHMRVEYSQDGVQRVLKDGNELTDFNPVPNDQAWGVIKDNMQNKGVVLVGTEWTGWVALSEECNSGDANRENEEGLARSSFSISNLVIMGSPVQGPTPQKCSQLGVNNTMIA